MWELVCKLGNTLNAFPNVECKLLRILASKVIIYLQLMIQSVELMSCNVSDIASCQGNSKELQNLFIAAELKSIHATVDKVHTEIEKASNSFYFIF